MSQPRTFRVLRPQPGLGRLLRCLIIACACLNPGLAATVSEDVEFAYLALGRLLKDGRFEDAWAICRMAAKLEPEKASHVYNAACCLARMGRTEAALDQLEESLRLGFNDLDLLRTDPDLESIRGRSRFRTAALSLEKKPDAQLVPNERGAKELGDLAGKWTSQSMRNDYDDGSHDSGGGEDYTPLFIMPDGTWRYGTQSGRVTVSDVSTSDLAFMDFKPTDNPKNLPKRKFELSGWAGQSAMCFWRIDEADGKPYRIVVHFRVRQPRPGLATWIRSRSPN